MKKTALKQYARLIVRTGANVQKGQDVFVIAEPDQPEFVYTVVEECYKAGAARVYVEFEYTKLKKLNVKYQKLDRLGRFDNWEIAKLAHRAKTLPCMIYLESADPDALGGMDQKKNGKAMQMRMPLYRSYRDFMENKYQWCIAAVAGKDWAKKMFPGERTSVAMEKLWNAILKTARADGQDPIADWEKHNRTLKTRCDYLNKLGLVELQYHGTNGTDLKVGIIEDALFLGGAEDASGSGITYNPNMPSEEVFITPKKGVAEGIVYSTKPFSYRGYLIENFSVRFENGRAVEVHAQKGEEALKEMISLDEGAAMLGECALVAVDSPISESGLVFYNTLFDENASCHLALGMGYSNNIRDYEKYTLQELRDKGVNNSMIHEDFMIGFEGLDIDGITKDGKKIPIFRKGTWAF